MSCSYVWPVAKIPMCDSELAGRRPRRRSSALALIARAWAAGASSGVRGNSCSAQAATLGSDAE